MPRHRHSLLLSEGASLTVVHMLAVQSSDSQSVTRHIKCSGIFTFNTICVSSNRPAPSTRGPLGCEWIGPSSFSPVYFGFGSARKRDVAIEVILDGIRLDVSCCVTAEANGVRVVESLKLTC